MEGLGGGFGDFLDLRGGGYLGIGIGGRGGIDVGESFGGGPGGREEKRLEEPGSVARITIEESLINLGWH